MDKDCGMWINVLFHKLRKYNNANMQSLGITGVQSRVMHYILVKCVEGPVFQRDVERAFGLSRSTATGILQLMEKNGFLLREPVAYDARLKKLVLTPKALAVHEGVISRIRATEARITKDVTPEELEQFFAITAKFRRNLE